MNHIDHLEFNVSAQNNEAALSDDTLMVLVQGKVLPIVDRVLDELSEPKKTLNIDRLNLDLGEFSSRDVHADLPRILYRRLRQSIIEHLSHSKAKVIPVGTHWLDHIFVKKNMTEALELWKAFAKEMSQSDRYLLHSLLMDQDNRRFVAHQMPDSIVFDIVKSLASMNANFIILLIQNHRAFNVNDDRPRQQIIEFSLSYLTCDRGGQFNKISYLRSVIKNMASHNNQSFIMLCEEIRNSTLQVMSNQELKRELLAVVNMELSLPSSYHSLKNPDDQLKVSPDYSADLRLLAGRKFEDELTNRQLVSVFNSALATHRNVLDNLFIKRKKDASFISFVCSVLPEASLYKILSLHTEGDFKRVCQCIDSLKLTLFRSGFIKDDSDLKSLFWKTALMFFLNNSSSIIDIECLKKIVSQYIYSIKRRFNMTEIDVIDRLTPCSQGLTSTQRFNDLYTVLSELGIKTQVLTSKEVEEVVSQADWLDQIVEAIAQGSWGFSDHLWQKLKEGSIDQLKSELRRALLHKASRSRVILGLERAQQLEIIQVLSTDAYNIVKPLWSDGFTLQPPNQSLEHSGRCGTLIKEFTLGYIVNDRGSEFNRKSFARGLLKQLSAHYNISYCELLDNLHEGLNNGCIPLGINTILREILDSNAQQAESVSEEKPDRPERGAALYFRLVELLNSQTSINKDTWSNTLQRLMNHYPTLLIRFVRELQHGIWNLNRIAEKLTEPSLQTLLDTVLVVTGHNNSIDDSELGLAIKRFSSRSKSSFQFVLESIRVVLAGGVIDLDQIGRNLIMHTSPADGRDSQVGDSLTHDKVKHSAMPSIEYAIETLTDVASDKQAFDRFLQLSESQQFSYYMAVDANKTRFLWPYITLLRNTLLGTDLTLSPKIFNRWVCQSVVGQLLFPRLPSSVDRCIQLLLQHLVTHMTTASTTHNWAILKSQLLAHLFDVSSALNTPIDCKRTEKLSKLLSSFSKADVGGVTTSALKPLGIASNAANTDTGIAVSNAGIVAIAPYIPMLFEKLKLISNQAFIDEQSRLKAMAALHYLAFSKPLYQSEAFVGCGLTKLLCGLGVSEAIDESVFLDHDEQTLCDSLLESVIGHWSVLGKTTIEGLRETFFQRDGVMTFDREKGWLLHVNTRSFDVLLDRIPWSYTTVKYQFMKNVIHVEWR